MNCPCCGTPMTKQAAAGGYAPPGFEPEDDHYWCAECSEAYDLDDPELESNK